MNSRVIGLGMVLAASSIATESFALRVERGGIVHLDALGDYATCQARSYSGRPCHEALLEWVKAHPGDAFAAGKLTRLHMNHYEAVPFFVKALEAKKGSCADEDVQMATLAGLKLPSDYPNAAGAKKIAFSLCKKELAGAVRAGLTSTGYYADNVCPSIKGEVPKDKLEFCSTTPEAPAAAPEKLAPGPDKTVNPYGKLFVGEGAEIELATFEERNASGLRDVLVRMKGADAHTDGVDGKVIRLVAVHGGNGVDYKYTSDKNEIFVRMSMRKSWGDNESYEVYFGSKTVKLWRDERRAKDVKPADLLKRYQAR